MNSLERTLAGDVSADVMGGLNQLYEILVVETCWYHGNIHNIYIWTYKAFLFLCVELGHPPYGNFNGENYDHEILGAKHEQLLLFAMMSISIRALLPNIEYTWIHPRNRWFNIGPIHVGAQRNVSLCVSRFETVSVSGYLWRSSCNTVWEWDTVILSQW